MKVRYHHGETALHIAAAKGDAEMVRALIAARADVNAVALTGETPLLKAASKGCAGTARALLDAGARVTLKDNTGETPLTVAARLGHREVVRLLRSALPLPGRLGFWLKRYASGLRAAVTHASS